MLVNNFKQLISFSDGNFTDVAGNAVAVENFLMPGMSAGTSTNRAANGFNNLSQTRHYNYNSTTASNSYVDEQTSYTWYNVVSTFADNATTMNNSTTNAGFRKNGFTMFVGTGDTAVTADDYKLDTPVTLDVLNASCVHNSDNTTVITRTFQNNTGNDVVIKEKGIYVFASQSGNSGLSSGGVPVVMIGRKVLDTPVTIPNGGAYTFTTTIDMSQITFSEADN